MKYLRLLLLPLSLLYGLAVIIRNWLYDAGLLKSRNFNMPIICIGNLAVGGAGKSPMTEYIVTQLKPANKVATLSRGYGRKTKGFLLADDNANATQIGDEPAQFHNKFPDVSVAVCEDRAAGIERLMDDHDVIVMDDAFQHRAVKAGLNIVLFDYTRMHEPQLLLPAGNLREPMSSRWRADILVISKCPAGLSNAELEELTDKIAPLPYQQLFFTGIGYQPLVSVGGEPSTTLPDENTTIFLLTGIANPAPLVDYLKGFTTQIKHHNYPDHHTFTLKNIAKLADDYHNCAAQKKLIITTEKDAQRLGEHSLAATVNKLPVLVLPIGITFLNNTAQQFDHLILNYVRKHTTHNIIH